MKKNNYFLLAVFTAVVAFTSQQAKAFPPYIYEGFDYEIGATPLNYNPLVPGTWGAVHMWKPASSWNGYGGSFSNTFPWGVTDVSPMVVPSLVQTGKYFNGNGEWVSCFLREINTDWNSPYWDYMDESKLGKSGTTLWFSVILRPQKNKKEAALGLCKAYNEQSVMKIGAFGGNYWGIRVNNDAEQALSTVPIVNDEAKFLVCKVEYTDVTGGTITLYIDPTPGVEPSNAAATLTTTSDIRFKSVQLLTHYSGGCMAADEIRIATTYDEVAPSTGPSTGLVQDMKKDIRVYSRDGKVVADLTMLKGLSTVSVIDTKGAVVKTIQNVGAESVTFDVANKGLYMVRVQNSGKSATLKVVL
ncbi:MAG TPA: T9SS type A sorting domain-containing protein [Paludibacteraceae bacterium]|nr:T9SS type A sorting domain-containing protein [Paludibacteraceae bacterium]HON02647.1 T9SS type A sorting domain-containing protein [Paludibacteraceae bacterium]HPD59460.1 T9SS type A sorting domain-containing protein [Paludibacteraceae bacterium]HPQ12752.1 T9SS type A sorting domain-containing protein [Paludibacteraceae bacterium]HRT78660.1 T9SS type A sorting domain-containing protein [Paludibacteraceae bacterium]